jgi:hypothetical protein
MRQSWNSAKSAAKEPVTAKAWRVAPVKPAAARAPLLRRLLGRAEPTTYQRCLAVHLHFASPRGGLS